MVVNANRLKLIVKNIGPKLGSTDAKADWVIIADIVNGLMALPNLIALLALSPVIISETKLYLEYLDRKTKLDSEKIG